MFVDRMPIDDIDPVRKIALAERLGEDRILVKGQASPGVDREIEIGISPGPPGRTRPEDPDLRATGQMRVQDIPNDPRVLLGDVERHVFYPVALMFVVPRGNGPGGFQAEDG